MIKAYCDFCGKEIDYHKTKLGIGLTYPPPYTFNTDVDYCDSAFDNFVSKRREYEKK
jgi:hypothetical protein